MVPPAYSLDWKAGQLLLLANDASIFPVLSRELRNEIYQLLLPLPDRPCSFNQARRRLPKVKRIIPPVAQVNAQTRNEVLDLFYSDRAFIVPKDSLDEFIRNIGDVGKTKLQRLHIDMRNQALGKGCFRALKHLNRLEKLNSLIFTNTDFLRHKFDVRWELNRGLRAAIVNMVRQAEFADQGGIQFFNSVMDQNLDGHRQDVPCEIICGWKDWIWKIKQLGSLKTVVIKVVEENHMGERMLADWLESKMRER